MECTLELTRSQYNQRDLFIALNPSEDDLARHPRSTLYVRNCFFERLDTIKPLVRPTTQAALWHTMLESLKALLKNPQDTSKVPMWGQAVDFQYLAGVPTEPGIYMNVNMDSSLKWTFCFSREVTATIKIVDGVAQLRRSSTFSPYKLKTLLKELGVK